MPRYTINWRAIVCGTLEVEGDDEDEAFDRALAELIHNDAWLRDTRDVDFDVDVAGAVPTAVEWRRQFTVVRPEKQ